MAVDETARMTGSGNFHSGMTDLRVDSDGKVVQEHQ